MRVLSRKSSETLYFVNNLKAALNACESPVGEVSVDEIRDCIAEGFGWNSDASMNVASRRILDGRPLQDGLKEPVLIDRMSRVQEDILRLQLVRACRGYLGIRHPMLSPVAAVEVITKMLCGRERKLGKFSLFSQRSLARRLPETLYPEELGGCTCILSENTPEGIDFRTLLVERMVLAKTERRGAVIVAHKSRMTEISKYASDAANAFGLPLGVWDLSVSDAPEIKVGDKVSFDPLVISKADKSSALQRWMRAGAERGVNAALRTSEESESFIERQVEISMMLKHVESVLADAGQERLLSELASHKGLWTTAIWQDLGDEAQSELRRVFMDYFIAPFFDGDSLTTELGMINGFGVDQSINHWHEYLYRVMGLDGVEDVAESTYAVVFNLLSLVFKAAENFGYDPALGDRLATKLADRAILLVILPDNLAEQETDYRSMTIFAMEALKLAMVEQPTPEEGWLVYLDSDGYYPDELDMVAFMQAGSGAFFHVDSEFNDERWAGSNSCRYMNYTSYVVTDASLLPVARVGDHLEKSLAEAIKPSLLSRMKKESGFCQAGKCLLVMRSLSAPTQLGQLRGVNMGCWLSLGG